MKTGTGSYFLEKKYKLFFALLSLLTLFFGCSSNNASSNIIPKAPDDLSAEILDIVTSSSVPAIVAAAVSSEGLQAIGAAGIRKVGDETKVTINDKFQLGSCTKALTATLMGIIINEGHTINGQMLSWTTTLGDIFPTLDNNRPIHTDYSSTTIAQLTHHRGQINLMKIGKSPDNKPKSIVDVLNNIDQSLTTKKQRRMWLTQEVLVAEAGIPTPNYFHYDNLNFMIIASIMEKVTEKSWEDLIQTYIFTPLEMTTCGFGLPHNSITTDQPWGHARTKENPPTFIPDPNTPYNGKSNMVQIDIRDFFSPAGLGVHCSIGDWAKYIQDILKGLQSKPSVLPQTVYQSTIYSTPKYTYEYGWVNKTTLWASNQRTLVHTGNDWRYFSEVWVAPNLDLAFLAFTNADTTSIWSSTIKHEKTSENYYYNVPLNDSINMLIERYTNTPVEGSEKGLNPFASYLKGNYSE